VFGVTSKYLAPQYGGRGAASAKTVRPRLVRGGLTLAVAGAACAGLAACSSSISSVASNPPGSTSSLPAISTSGAASAIASALSSSDCTVLKDISGSAITTLTPLETDPSKASSLLKTYIAQLTADESKVTSTAAKNQIKAWIAALNKSQTESTADATSTITKALGSIAKGCA
jgi:hypothetical protein